MALGGTFSSVCGSGTHSALFAYEWSFRGQQYHTFAQWLELRTRHQVTYPDTASEFVSVFQLQLNRVRR